MTAPAPPAVAEERFAGYRRDPWFGTRAMVTLPWPADPQEKSRLVENSLGPAVIDWAEGRGDGPGLIHYQTGDPWRFTDGQKRFLILWYGYDPETGRFTFRRGVKRGAKGTGKDPFAAAWLNGELCGPTQLAWDEDEERWYGRPHGMPLVQIASNSEAQSKDVLRVANAMWSRDAREFYDLDCGETRTNIRSTGGRMEVLTASEMSAEGDPATAIALNETHHMTRTSGGHRVAAVARRNVGKSPAYLQARMIDFTNAHTMGSDSTGERSFDAWQKQVANPALKLDILYDSIEAPPELNAYDPKQRRLALEAAYADAPWADLERLDGEVMDAETTLSDTIRFYFNGLAAAEDAWIDPRKFDALSRPDVVVAEGTQIAMFLDCSKSGDATGLVGCRLSDGFVFKIGCWVPPRGKDGEGYLVPREEVDGAVCYAFDRYRIEWFGVDPSPAKDDETEALYWLPQIDEWHQKFHKKLKVWAYSPMGHKATNSVLFDMRIKTPGGQARNALFTQAAMQTASDIDETGTLTWDGDTLMKVHVHASKRRPNPWGVSLSKVTRDSEKHVDLAVCMVGARMGRRIVLNSGKVKARRDGARSGRAVF